MKEWLILATHYSVVLIDAMALFVIVGGTIEAFTKGLYHLFTSSDPHESRGIWLRYARWLVAGLTFQLAADIIETSIAPTWDDIGRLAVIAIIRTFLNYFLERDLGEVRERQSDRESVSASEPRRELHRRLEVDHA
jgi:uncharacterized membrane protein